MIDHRLRTADRRPLSSVGGWVFSPSRSSPIGAHIDHQGGAVLGLTIKLGTTLEYSPLDLEEIHITSDQFGEAQFFIGDEIDEIHWARYAQAAVRVFPNLKRGMKMHVSGSLIGAGLSSSASVGLAYLKALADVNDIEVSNNELVQLDYELENGQLGLQNGILDLLTIVYGKRNALLFMDTITASVTPIFDSPSRDSVWTAAYLGISREPTKSGFNVRVAECHEAASFLHSRTWKLFDVPRELYEEKKTTLAENLRRRAVDIMIQAGSKAHGLRQSAPEEWKNEIMGNTVVE